MLRFSAAIEGSAIQSRMRFSEASRPASAALRIASMFESAASTVVGRISIAPPASIAPPRIKPSGWSLF
jgi:hypothetical protein